MILCNNHHHNYYNGDIEVDDDNNCMIMETTFWSKYFFCSIINWSIYQWMDQDQDQDQLEIDHTKVKLIIIDDFDRYLKREKNIYRLWWMYQSQEAYVKKIDDYEGQDQQWWWWWWWWIFENWMNGWWNHRHAVTQRPWWLTPL